VWVDSWVADLACSLLHCCSMLRSHSSIFWNVPLTPPLLLIWFSACSAPFSTPLTLCSHALFSNYLFPSSFRYTCRSNVVKLTHCHLSIKVTILFVTYSTAMLPQYLSAPASLSLSLSLSLSPQHADYSVLQSFLWFLISSSVGASMHSTILNSPSPCHRLAHNPDSGHLERQNASHYHRQS